VKEYDNNKTAITTRQSQHGEEAACTN